MTRRELQLPPIRQGFLDRKQAILESLDRPASTYTDASPKGSVDEAILPLINLINSHEGLITTSSCAGRISVFLEGSKRGPQPIAGPKQSLKDGATQSSKSTPSDLTAIGGKGNGGQWLYVSHDPLPVAMNEADEKVNLMQLFGLKQDSVSESEQCRMTMDDELMSLIPIHNIRQIRFQFEPAILHVCANSLPHASTLLTAAVNAGFRESGIQSLRSLYTTDAYPMVAIRTAGVSFQSLIGVQMDVPTTPNEKDDLISEANRIDGQGLSRMHFHRRPLVTESSLLLLLRIANARFQANTERMNRLYDDLKSKNDQHASLHG